MINYYDCAIVVISTEKNVKWNGKIFCCILYPMNWAWRDVFMLYFLVFCALASYLKFDCDRNWEAECISRKSSETSSEELGKLQNAKENSKVNQRVREECSLPLAQATQITQWLPNPYPLSPPSSYSSPCPLVPVSFPISLIHLSNSLGSL